MSTTAKKCSKNSHRRPLLIPTTVIVTLIQSVDKNPFDKFTWQHNNQWLSTTHRSYDWLYNDGWLFSSLFNPRLCVGEKAQWDLHPQMARLLELGFSCGAFDGFETPIVRTLHEACEQFVRRILIIRQSDPELQKP